MSVLRTVNDMHSQSPMTIILIVLECIHACSLKDAHSQIQPGVKVHMVICSNCLIFAFPSTWVKIFSMQTELNFKINWRPNGMWRLTYDSCLWPLVQTVTSWNHHTIQFDLFWHNKLLYYETVKQAWNKPLLHVYLIYERVSFFLQSWKMQKIRLTSQLSYELMKMETTLL